LTAGKGENTSRLPVRDKRKKISRCCFELWQDCWNKNDTLHSPWVLDLQYGSNAPLSIKVPACLGVS